MTIFFPSCATLPYPLPTLGSLKVSLTSKLSLVSRNFLFDFLTGAVVFPSGYAISPAAHFCFEKLLNLIQTFAILLAPAQKIEYSIFCLLCNHFFRSLNWLQSDIFVTTHRWRQGTCRGPCPCPGTSSRGSRGWGAPPRWKATRTSGPPGSWTPQGAPCRLPRNKGVLQIFSLEQFYDLNS